MIRCLRSHSDEGQRALQGLVDRFSEETGCREAVEDGVSGYICPAKDADALYDAMQRFVELPESWRAEMGRRGREQMEKRFSKDAVVAETMKWLWIING